MHKTNYALQVSRRSLLAGVGAGALTFSPFVSALKSAIAREASGAAPPMRFVFFVKSNGLWPELLQPESMRDQLPFSYETEIVKTKHHPEAQLRSSRTLGKAIAALRSPQRTKHTAAS